MGASSNMKIKKSKDLNELKKELETDSHIVELDELYRRYGTNPKKVTA